MLKLLFSFLLTNNKVGKTKIAWQKKWVKLGTTTRDLQDRPIPNITYKPIQISQNQYTPIYNLDTNYTSPELEKLT